MNLQNGRPGPETPTLMMRRLLLGGCLLSGVNSPSGSSSASSAFEIPARQCKGQALSDAESMQRQRGERMQIFRNDSEEKQDAGMRGNTSIKV